MFLLSLLHVFPELILQDAAETEPPVPLPGEEEQEDNGEGEGRVLAVPASSAPVERVFSHGGIILRPHRAHLDRKACYVHVFAFPTPSSNLFFSLSFTLFLSTPTHSAFLIKT